MAAAGLVFAGLSALVGAIGAGVSSSAATSSAERQSEQEREARASELKKKREQEKFQFGFTALAEQRRSAEQTARRSMFNKQVFQAMRGSPGISTF